jgi:hypothetical protein
MPPVLVKCLAKFDSKTYFRIKFNLCPNLLFSKESLHNGKILELTFYVFYFAG